MSKGKFALVIPLALVSLLLLTPSASADKSYRYGNYTHGYAGRWKKDGYYKYSYYYQPTKGAQYKYHYVYYYPVDHYGHKNYYYYYNTKTGKYWGRCRHGQNEKYELLPPEKQKPELKDIDKGDFVRQDKMPTVPDMEPGTPILSPPEPPDKD